MSRGKKILVFLIVIILLITVVIVSNIFIQNKNINRIDISITYGKSDTIINSKEISEELLSKFGDFIKKKRKDVDEKDIEDFLLNDSYIEKAQVYQTIKGVLNIEIKQREPIVRIYTLRGKEYYIDKIGKLIQIKNNETTDVIVASGNIDVSSNILSRGFLDTINIKEKKGFEKTLSNIYNIAQKLKNDSILNYQIDQINVTEKGTYELIPKIGNYIIRICENENLNEQFIKLDYLYKEGFSRSGWDNYIVVDLRFRNQVVCTRKGGVEETITNEVLTAKQ